MKTVSCKNIKITDGFWKVKQDMVNNVTLKSVYYRFKETHRFDALDCTWKEGRNTPHRPAEDLDLLGATRSPESTLSSLLTSSIPGESAPEAGHAAEGAERQLEL